MLLFVSACGYESPVFKHKGLSVWADDGTKIRKADFAKAVAELNAFWWETYKQPTQHYFENNPQHIHFLADIIDCGEELSPETGKCSGLTQGDVTYISLVNGCIADSTLLHELVHILRQAKLGDADSTHKDSMLWTWADAWGPAGLRNKLTGCVN